MTPSDVPTNFPEEMAALIRKAGSAWLDKIQKDQFNRWFERKGVPAEAYLAAVPALQTNIDAFRGLIEREYQHRLDFGERQSPTEFLLRFPQHADLLRSQLERCHALESNAAAPSEDSASSAENPTDSEEYPSHLGGFQIHSLLGEGGQGLVYRAYDPRLFRDVALKVMKRSLLAEPAARRRFLREAQKMAAASSDHVVTIFQSGEVDGSPFLVMELLRGEPLSGRLKRRRLSWQNAVRIGLETARGLEAVHRRGVIHRDITPANIWLEDLRRDSGESWRERVKILDFGLARTFRVDEQHTLGFVGTPPYSSPEQASCKECDNRTDLFSLGCVLYHMVAGQQPFSGRTSRDILRQVQTLHPPPAAELAPEIPNDLSGLIERMMAKDPAQRPVSAAEVVRSLSCLMELDGGTRDARLPGNGLAADPHLADVLGAWATLPTAIRRAIVSLVESARSDPSEA